MSLNKNALMARIKKLSQEANVDVNTILTSFFFDAFLYRVANSTYKEDFTFKGGYYLCSVLGINNRYTRDLDFKIREELLGKESLIDIFNDIISISLEDNITFDFIAIRKIRDEDQYGGFSIRLMCHLENITEYIDIDVATGDPITPNRISYQYPRLIEDSYISIYAYNLETVLSEKLQTVLSRGNVSSRIKDFYDLYLIYNIKWNNINKTNLREAYNKTCLYRETIFSKNKCNEILQSIKDSPDMRLRWTHYFTKNKYPYTFSLDEGIDIIQIILSFIYV